MSYFFGQGRVYLGARDPKGQPLGLNYVGNVPELKVSLSVETLDHQESSSGQRLTDLQLIKTKKGEFSCTLEELIPINLALALYGTTTAQTGGTVTAETLPMPLTIGNLDLLGKQNVSNIAIRDSATPPKTVALEQVRLNGRHGSIVFNDLTTGGPYTEPLLVDYAYGAASSMWMLTMATSRWSLIYIAWPSIRPRSCR